jgi:hypothetical protein
MQFLEIGSVTNMERFLGMSIKREGDEVRVNQEEYARHAAHQAGLDDGRKPPSTPIQGGEMKRTTDALVKSLSLAALPERVMKLIGLSRYLADHTRLDILYAASRSLCDESGKAAERVLRYIDGTASMPLVYRKGANGIKLTAFVDASFNAHPDGACYFGYAIFLNLESGAIFATAKKISSISPTSVMECEHYACGEVCKTVLHFRYLLEEIGVRLSEPSEIYCDNASTILKSEREAYSHLTRHFHPRRHAIRHWQREGLVRFVHIRSAKNIADIFTKSLTVERFEMLRDALQGVIPISSLVE